MIFDEKKKKEKMGKVGVEESKIVSNSTEEKKKLKEKHFEAGEKKMGFLKHRPALQQETGVVKNKMLAGK